MQRSFRVFYGTMRETVVKAYFHRCNTIKPLRRQSRGLCHRIYKNFPMHSGEEENEVIIGVDHGNAQIKTKNTCFVSGLEEFPTKPPMAADIIQYQGRYWTLVGKRLPVMRDKTKDDRFYLLTLFAIAKELEARRADSSTLSITVRSRKASHSISGGRSPCVSSTMTNPFASCSTMYSSTRRRLARLCTGHRK